MAQQQTQQTQQKDKAVLAYSGGLDTSVCIKWLQEEKNLDVIAVVGDVGQEHEGLEKIKQKALKTGAVECLVVDMRRRVRPGLPVQGAGRQRPCTRTSTRSCPRCPGR